MFDLGREVIGKRMLHARQEYKLSDRLAADAAELGRKVLWLLDARDLMTRRATVIGNPALTA